MYRNISHGKMKLFAKLKRILACSILFIAAVLPWRLRVLFCGMLYTVNYKKKEGVIVGERVTEFFFDCK